MWSFDPAKVNRTLTKVADVRANGVIDADSDGCGSIAIAETTAYISFSSLGETEFRYRAFDISNSFAAIQQWTTADWYFANVISSYGVGYTVAPITNGATLETWTAPNSSAGTVEITPLAPRVSVHSLRFDGRGNLWAAAWMDDGIQLGKVDLSTGATAWGSRLKKARGNSSWFTDTIVYVPKTAMH